VAHQVWELIKVGANRQPLLHRPIESARVHEAHWRETCRITSRV